MNLYIHLSIHIFFSLLSGFIAWRLWKKPIVSMIAGLAGGFLVDFDHFIDYFLAFGWNFRLDYFLSGYQFLKSDKIYVLFHAWEYVIIFAGAVFFIKNRIGKSLLLGVALGLLFHLATDVVIDEVPPRTYSIVYRLNNNFDLEKLVYPDHWEDHKTKKKITSF